MPSAPPPGSCRWSRASPRTVAALAALGLLAAAPAPAGAAGGDPRRAEQYGLDLIEADAAPAGLRGQGARVGVIDTGVRRDHPDLVGRLAAGRDFVDDDDDPTDLNGHGTHVTGIIAANADNGIGVRGAAPEATIVPVRALNADGAGSAQDIADGIDWALTQNVDVINLSLGGPLPLPALGVRGPLEEGIERALDRGVIVVAAAGNNSLPLCEQNTQRGRLLCVGAVGPASTRASFSSFGLGLSLVAPGEGILSTSRTGDYERISGTSEAAPFVAGVAAQLVSAGIRGQAAVQRILAGTRDLGAPGRDLIFGFGLLNVRTTLAGLQAPAAPATGSSVRAPGAGVRIPARLRRAAVLRRGLRVRCSTLSTGRCSVTLTARGTQLATGSRTTRAMRAVTVVARPTRAGRRLLRRSGRLQAVVTVSRPGEPILRRTVTLSSG